MKCRSTERRQWIVNNYNVVLVAHIQLLAGQTKHSDAGAMIDNDYYIFHVIDKVSERREIIQCGMGAARDFLRLIGHEGLPLFNPLQGDGAKTSTTGKSSKGSTSGDKKEDIVVWNPIAKQLYNAIMWLIIIIDAEPDTPIFDIREKVYKFRDKPQFQSNVKAVNTIIGKTLGGKTLTEKIDELRADNDVRENMCQFGMLVEVINNYVDKDGNHIEIEPLF